MRILRNINIRNEELSSGLSEASYLFHVLENNFDDKIVLDFSETQIVTPTFVIPLVIYLKGYGHAVSFENTPDYLRDIHLDSFGVDAGSMRRAEFGAFMEKYVKTSYVPIVCFPSSSDRLEVKNSVISTVESVIVTQSGMEHNVVNGLKYALNEIADNIHEHSNSDKGYIFAQSYPESGFVDLCVGDTGITLLGSFRKNGRYVMDNDMDAMQAANFGISTKNLPSAENRGYGIHTTKNMIVNGLGGQYMMVSGTNVYISTPDGEGYIDFPFGIRLPGTMIAMRIPIDNKKFNYINYIE